MLLINKCRNNRCASATTPHVCATDGPHQPMYAQQYASATDASATTDASTTDAATTDAISRIWSSTTDL